MIVRRFLALTMLVGLALLVLPVLPAEATGYTVCPSGCSYASIQAAVNAASAGATITVGPGTYVEHVRLKGGVVLLGAGADVTTIRSDGGRVVVFGPDSSIGPNTLVEGFTITGGTGVDGPAVFLRQGASPTLRRNRVQGNSAQNGGGIYIENASPVLEDNLVRNNSASDHGGGIVIIGSSSAPTLRGNTVENNTAGHDGGGIVIQNGASGLLEDNSIRGNECLGSAASTGIGGGIKIFNNAHPLLRGNRIEDNTAHADGGGIYIEAGSFPTLEHNIIANNQAANFGGGLVVRDAQPVLFNNLIVYNQATDGDGLFLRVSGPVRMTSNTIAANGNGEGVVFSESHAVMTNNLVTGHGVGLSADGNSGADLSHNNVWGNSTNYEGIAPGATDLSTDPKLTSGPHGDYYLLGSSPLIDRGEASAVATGLDDRTTQVDERPDQGQVDIGYHHPIGGPRPQAPQVDIARNGTDLTLSWLHVTQDTGGSGVDVTCYQIWRSTTPCFEPYDGNESNHVEEIEPPDGTTGEDVLTYVHEHALGDPAISYYYFVRALSAEGMISDNSNRVGTFSMPLVPGQ